MNINDFVVLQPEKWNDTEMTATQLCYTLIPQPEVFSILAACTYLNY
jgi:hypothetical protein